MGLLKIVKTSESESQAMITEELIEKGAKSIEKKLDQIYGYEKSNFLNLAYQYSSGAVLYSVLIEETIEINYLADSAYDGWKQAFYEYRWTQGEEFAEDMNSELLENGYSALPLDEKEKYREMATAVLDMLSAH
jgi:hypothetical protein